METNKEVCISVVSLFRRVIFTPMKIWWIYFIKTFFILFQRSAETIIQTKCNLILFMYYHRFLCPIMCTIILYYVYFYNLDGLLLYFSILYLRFAPSARGRVVYGIFIFIMTVHLLLVYAMSVTELLQFAQD